MILQCKNCGAPLDVAGDDPSVKCRYCGLSNRVRKMKTLHMQTPANWTPPAAWQPTNVIDRVGRIVLMRVIWFVMFVAFASVVLPLIAGGALVGVLGNIRLPIPGRGMAAQTWDGTKPFECGGNDTVSFVGVRARLPGLTAIRARDNCEIELTNCDIEAEEGIVATGNRSVIIRNSRIVTSGVGIRGRGNRSIELHDTTITASTGAAIDLGNNAEATINRGRIEGHPHPTAHVANARITSSEGVEFVGDAPAPAAAHRADTPSHRHHSLPTHPTTGKPRRRHVN